jgi:hypothetical protein
MKDWGAVGKSKDAWAGVIFLAVGGIFVGFSRNYEMGEAMSMGPAYFPAVLGGLLALIGIALIVRALFRPGLPVERLAVNKVALVAVPVVLFALLLRRTGLAVALILLVVGSSYASRRFQWRVALSLAVGLAVGASIVFVWLLQLPIPIFGAWLGG